jgi:hypothetical protein
MLCCYFNAESNLEYTTDDGVEYVPFDEEREEIGMDEDEDEDQRTDMELQRVSSPLPVDIDDGDDDDDDGGLGDFYFCHICQKDLTRFSESRRQTHINRCCDKQEEEEKESTAAAKEGQSSAFACLLCEKSFKSDNVRVMIIIIALSPAFSMLPQAQYPYPCEHCIIGMSLVGWDCPSICISQSTDIWSYVYVEKKPYTDINFV